MSHEERGHSQIGASSAERWMTCPGSVALSLKAPPEKPSPYAAEGTAAHELAETCLLNNGVAETYIGEDFNGFKVTQEMADAVQVYLDTIDSYYEELDEVELYVEEKFDLGHIHKDLYGTNDACLVAPNGKVVVLDYKHGKGIAVDVEENKQLMYYALGAVKDVEGWTEVELVIVQPRAEHPDGPVRKWKATKKRLEQFAKELKKAALATTQAGAALVPSDKGCKFCRAKAICPARKEEAYTIAKAEFDDVSNEVTLPKPDSLSNEEIVKVLKASTRIKDFLDAVQSHAHIAAEGGRTIPGYKLVKKRASRKWKDESDVISKFSPILDESDLFERKLLSPAKLEKVIGKKDVDGLTITPDTGTVLVPESDKRKEVTPQIQQDFQDDFDI